MAHSLNPSNWETEASRSFKFKASMVYRASSRTDRATEKLLSRKQKKRRKKTNTKRKEVALKLGVLFFRE